MGRIVSPAEIELAGLIRPGDGVIWGQAAAEPQTLVEALVAQRAEYSGARPFMGISYSGIVRPEHADHLRLSAYCGAGSNRALAAAGVLDICPFPYSQFAALIRAGRIRADVVLIQVSPPNANGEHSLGLAAEYLLPALRSARSVIAEINDQVPWTYGERVLLRDEIALAEAVATGRVKPGDRILMSAFGAGGTSGAVVLEWTADPADRLRAEQQMLEANRIGFLANAED